MNGLNEEREKLIQRIESVRAKLNRSIDEKEDYAAVYQYSVELDALIEQYMGGRLLAEPARAGLCVHVFCLARWWAVRKRRNSPVVQ